MGRRKISIQRKAFGRALETMSLSFVLMVGVDVLLIIIHIYKEREEGNRKELAHTACHCFIASDHHYHHEIQPNMASHPTGARVCLSRLPSRQYQLAQACWHQGRPISFLRIFLGVNSMYVSSSGQGRE